jgi:hypothetical protein
VNASRTPSVALRSWRVLSLVGFLGVAGCGASSGTTSPTALATVAATPLPSSQAAQLLSFDASTKTVTLTITVGIPEISNGYNFNGYVRGALVISVPKGWKVIVHCNAHPYALAHSCAVVQGPGIERPAFPGSWLPNPNVAYLGGFVLQGSSKSFEFTPNRALVGRFACLVTGHEAAGMWATFQVTDSGQPSLGTRPPTGS